MRSIGILLATSAFAMLAACSGGSTGAQSAGSTAVSTGPSTTATGTFVNPTTAKTYSGIGAVEHYEYYTNSNGSGQGGQLYAGDAGTARDGGFSIAYDPRDAIFDITITRTKGNVSATDMRFQDPAHRTAFGGLKQPQAGVPQLSAAKNIQYLQSGGSTGNLLPSSDPDYDPNSTYVQGANGYTSTVQTFFYQKPGTTTSYVTYAGFVRNTISAATQTDANGNSYLRQSYNIDHAAFVWGEQTGNSAVPTTGTGTYTGDMLATLVFNDRIDTDPSAPTYFQWIDGSQTTTVNFASKTLSSTFTGTVTAPDRDAHTSGAFNLPGGSTFNASATGTIDLINKGGFTGSFTSASFTRPGMTTYNIAIAGSSLDGAFFGPAAEEIGGSFRVVGGNPDERIDILGAFTGKK